MTATDTDRWLSYADAATALGMTTEGVRQRARREGWRRQLGNDGRARILVSSDTTARTPAGDPVGNDAPAPDDTPTSPPVTPPDTAREMEALRAHLASAGARVIELRADLDRERADVRRERDRADALTDRVADLAAEMARAVGEAAGAERGLSTRLAGIEAALAEYRARPWWRRLAG